MRLLVTTLALSSIFFSFGQQEDVELLKDEVKVAKNELRANLNGLKYDGSKTTYYEVRGENSFKDLEVILFLRESYTLKFSGKPSRGKVLLRIYDLPADNANRIMLFEEKNISGKIIDVTSTELNNMLAVYRDNPQKLRSVYVEYEITKGKPVRGAVALVLGY